MEDEEWNEEEEEEEGNADLTLGILSKALGALSKAHSQRAAELSSSPSDPAEDVSKVDESKEITDLTPDRDGALEIVKEKGVKRRDAGEEGDEDDGLEKHGKSSKRNKCVDYGKGEVEDKSNAEKRSRKRSKARKPKDDEPAVLATETKEVNPPPENLAFRKILRQPRYFDDPEDIEASRATCYNCGDPGHLAFECTAPKPCYVCGDFAHDGRHCNQQSQCFKCGKTGHQARACPEKGKRGRGGARQEEGVCLLCGNSGHGYGSCRGDYEASDLEAIQCYVCKKFGHLCCLDGLGDAPRLASCYNCGDTGHSGMACTRTRGNSFPPTPKTQSAKSQAAKSQAAKNHSTPGAKNHGTPTPQAALPPPPPRPSKQCFSCGEEGHFSRECPKVNDGAATPVATPAPAATPRRGEKCYNCGGEGHFARECSNPPSTPSCYKCGETGHVARQCSAQPQAKRNPEPETKLPRWMEIQTRDDRQQQQQLNGLLTPQKMYHRVADQDQRNSKKQKALAEFAQEKSAIRLPKWCAVESAEQR
ncbi:uncharacterized protein LOC112347622 [Selaginella moellendorffii]|uniref:uncharacterized protein LOC112347622 n=1 Tax=Selaginella moellendorffii TaxID=88036 RepID=UPI000D1C2F61|nr:uncharacterized protein LOC112347622 [Selaginella moellendorffii]|eukprot:XP_024534510.1 uncharacterized protein LOC112347622 [Selaginella moellendorffii]